MKNADMPAMPQTITDSNDNSGLVGSHMEAEWQGLTKREMFAMHAMQGILSNGTLMDAIFDSCKRKNAEPHDVVADVAIEHATSLLIKLEKSDA